MRKEAWKYLLGFFPFGMTDIERMELREKKESEYWTMKNQWQSFTQDQERRFAKWRELKHLISKLINRVCWYTVTSPNQWPFYCFLFPSDKDVLRTDRDHPLFTDPKSPKLVQLEEILKTYVMYNFDLGTYIYTCTCVQPTLYI